MTDETISLKITLLGDCGVGKSSIIYRYNTGSFKEHYNSTCGGSYSQKLISINDKTLQLDIWDTAGQEKYRSIGKNFYREAYIIILVYDITRKNSLEGLKNTWYPDVTKYGEKYKILAVVGNKCDLYEEENVVSEEEARNFANEIKAQFFIVSAKNGTNINSLFNNLIVAFWNPNFQEQISENTFRKTTTQKINRLTINEEKEFNKKKKKNCCK